MGLAGIMVTVLLSVSCGGGVESEVGEGEAVAATAAPDFTLALGAGGAFTLSEQTKPVLIIFWAEW